MTRTVARTSLNVDYRYLTDAPFSGRGLHLGCWRAVQACTRAVGGLVATYDLDGTANDPQLVTCPVCDDSWTLSGPAVTPTLLVGVRQAVLVACLRESNNLPVSA